MERNGTFADFDNEHVFTDSRRWASDQATKNFVIEFGSQEAQIAFNLDEGQFQAFLNDVRPDQRPVRWINIWGPHFQKRSIECLAQKYGFSVRLKALIQEDPPKSEEEEGAKRNRWLRGKFGKPEEDTEEENGKEKEVADIDVERAIQNGTYKAEPPLRRRDTPMMKRQQATHYKIVAQMMNYHAIDCGEKFICLGANWMHERHHQPKKTDDWHDQTRNKATETEIKLEEQGNQRRLYTWLVLCSDNTVISINEDPGIDNHPQDLENTRSNLLSVFGQLSKWQPEDVNAISMLALRTSLNSVPIDKQGKEGASNLFYYLFDDWRAVYDTVENFQLRLLSLQNRILNVTSRKSVNTFENDILPALHLLGKQIRQMHHVYEGYKNLVQRTLEPPRSAYTGDPRTPTSPTSFGLRVAQATGRQGPELAPSAVARFERLSDRLQLLILSETKEFLMEKDALANTYFSINAQKDSEATARLTRAAGLLAKLSVLFLPVSLMTGYFSIQIQELDGVYTVKDYWYSFAVIMSISFLFLFFFGRLLMYITETFDDKVAGWLNMQIANFWSFVTRRKKSKKS